MKFLNDICACISVCVVKSGRINAIVTVIISGEWDWVEGKWIVRFSKKYFPVFFFQACIVFIAKKFFFSFKVPYTVRIVEFLINFYFT